MSNKVMFCPEYVISKYSLTIKCLEKENYKEKS